MTNALRQIDLQNYPLVRRGKVRDVFDLGEELLLVATDRISAFDVVLPSLLPEKGVVLTTISQFWFDHIGVVIPTQKSPRTLSELDITESERQQLEGRSVIARKAERIDIECVVRAWLAGTAWLEYQKSRTVAGIPMPDGLKRGSRLPEPLFTPAMKNDDGHDANITVAQLINLVGEDLASRLEQSSFSMFDAGTRIAARAGFVLADTKFEFGWIDGELAVIDEVLTPDSSRYWDQSQVGLGTEPPQYDKQVIRDWLETTGWNKQPPGPELPQDIIQTTMDRYRAVSTRLQQTRDHS